MEERRRRDDVSERSERTQRANQPFAIRSTDGLSALGPSITQGHLFPVLKEKPTFISMKVVVNTPENQHRQWFTTYHLDGDSSVDEQAKSHIRLFEHEDFPEVQAYRIVYEVGKKGETPHFHSIFQLTNKIRFSTLKRIFTDLGYETIHFEPLKSFKGSSVYLNKEKLKSWEFQVDAFQSQGQRSDLSELAEQLVKGEITLTEAKYLKPNLYVQYGKGLRSLTIQSEHTKERQPCHVTEAKTITELTREADFIYTNNWNGYNPQIHHTVGILLSDRMTINHVRILATSKNPFVNVGYETIAFTSPKIIFFSENNY